MSRIRARVNVRALALPRRTNTSTWVRSSSLRWSGVTRFIATSPVFPSAYHKNQTGLTTSPAAHFDTLFIDWPNLSCNCGVNQNMNHHCSKSSLLTTRIYPLNNVFDYVFLRLHLSHSLLPGRSCCSFKRPEAHERLPC